MERISIRIAFEVGQIDRRIGVECNGVLGHTNNTPEMTNSGN